MPRGLPEEKGREHVRRNKSIHEYVMVEAAKKKEEENGEISLKKEEKGILITTLERGAESGKDG